MNSNQVLQQFQETDALLEGHFILSSGLHSSKYLQCAIALQYPADAARFGRAIAEHFADTPIEAVASPAIGGLVIGYATAAAILGGSIFAVQKLAAHGYLADRKGATPFRRADVEALAKRIVFLPEKSAM